MVEISRLKAVKVTGLQEMFNYEVKFPSAGDVVILIAPNGYGKTALLSLLNCCLQFRTDEAVKHSFKSLEVFFEDGTRWLFEKSIEERDTLREVARDSRTHRRRFDRPTEWVKARIFDKAGIEQDRAAFGDLATLPPDLLESALERTLPISRQTFDTFVEMRAREIMTTQEVVERYRHILVNDERFIKLLGAHEAVLFSGMAAKRRCVFIETQRLLFTRAAAADGTQSAPAEEILRQAQQLAALLQATYSNYAAISQGLDRSFPNRLIARAAIPGPRVHSTLRTSLNSVEERRKALTDAGILVETSEPLVPPKDEYLDTVADALEIYVEDSNRKLDTFDDIFPKISVFRELLTKKLRPKELSINREKGAAIQRGDKSVPLQGLSSGEKHEFIMLFKLIFETPKDSLVLIDEPEISLHVLWQLEFMSDLRSIQGANRFQAIVATHSPQVIQGMEEFIVDLADQAQ